MSVSQNFFPYVLYLWYDSESVPEVMQTDGGNIYIIYDDAASGSLDYSEQAVCQAWFSSSGAAHYTNLNIMRDEVNVWYNFMYRRDK